MKANIGIADKHRASVVQILNQILSDEFILFTKLRNYHWNVTGPEFSELHKLFQTQYEEVDVIIDDTAERARALGGNALGTLSEFLKNSKLKEVPNQYPKWKKMVENLLKDHESLIQNLRTALDLCSSQYRDMGTSDFLTGIMEQHEKMAWMLRVHLDS